MKISVIIPHLNQRGYLLRCIEALTLQINPPSWEAIVVDNGSRVLPNLEKFASKNIFIRHEERRGPGYARNTGVSSATGNILAFTDSDCVPALDWLASIKLAFDNPNTFIIGGEMNVQKSPDARCQLHLPYEKVYSFRNRLHVEEGYSSTGNMAVRREVFETVGRFGGIDIAEDRNWGLRATSMGITVSFREEIRVAHHARASYRELQLKWYRHVEHERAEWTSNSRSIATWLFKAFLLPISPLFEIVTLLTTDKLSGAGERFLALMYLIKIRVFRAYVMFALVFNKSKTDVRKFWEN
ncbi:MAG: glycosyltransferase [Litoreibacter sp.]